MAQKIRLSWNPCNPEGWQVYAGRKKHVSRGVSDNPPMPGDNEERLCTAAAEISKPRDRKGNKAIHTIAQEAN